jgi:hypothetical protein
MAQLGAPSTTLLSWEQRAGMASLAPTIHPHCKCIIIVRTTFAICLFLLRSLWYMRGAARPLAAQATGDTAASHRICAVRPRWSLVVAMGGMGRPCTLMRSQKSCRPIIVKEMNCRGVFTMLSVNNRADNGRSTLPTSAYVSFVGISS